MEKQKMDPVLGFLYALIASGVYDLIDMFVLTPSVHFGLLPADPLFVHRSITHTVWFFLGLSILATVILGKEYFRTTILIGLLAHLLPDTMTGGVQLFKPILNHHVSFPIQFPLMAESIFTILSLILLRKQIARGLKRLKRIGTAYEFNRTD